MAPGQRVRMRVVIATTVVPFLAGGGTMIVDSLEREIARRGVSVETVRIPFLSSWRELPAQTLAIRMLDLTESGGVPIDRLITIRYPSYALRHQSKVVWFLHHHRAAYDLWGTPFQDIPNDEEGLRARNALMRSDTHYLREARGIYTISQTVSDRLRTFSSIEPNGVLYPPHPNPELFVPGDFGDYFIYAARLTPIKRQVLAIEAMRHVRSSIGLVLIGAPDMESDRLELEQLILRHELADRVHLLGWVSEKEKARLTAEACGALYLAYDEDGLGYSTLEAAHAHKPIITLSDSGGPLEIVEDGRNGFVVEPNAIAVAAAMERLSSDRVLARKLGDEAFTLLAMHGVNWDHVLDRLLEV
jgi:glycosyltransferase involved in cell wall biosynthesis